MNPIIIKIKNKLAVIFAILGIIVGILLARFYSDRIPRFISPALPYLSLSELETDLENEQISLKSQISTAQDQINSLTQKVNKKEVEPQIEEVDQLKQSIGLTEIKGAGVEITLDDPPERRLDPNMIAHASDLRDLVDYLWQNNAQAISITGAGNIEERVGPTTSIDCIVNTVLINGVKIVPPFKIKAVGDSQKLLAAVNDQNQLKDIYARKEKENLTFNVASAQDLSTPKFTGNIILQYAKSSAQGGSPPTGEAGASGGKP